MKRKILVLCAALAVVALCFMLFHMNPCETVSEKKITAAVVAGFMIPFRELSADFGNKTGIQIEASYSSAGKLYAQIINGAPYDILLADEERSAKLKKEGYTDTVFVYGKGEVVLWSADKTLCNSVNWKDALKHKKIQKIAIANPEIAVYGMSAKKALDDAKLWKFVESRLITTLDLAQVFQYAITGSVDAGFCALAQALSDKGKNGSWCLIKEAPVIIHSGCILNRTENKELAQQFAVYLDSPDARNIKKKYGYK